LHIGVRQISNLGARRASIGARPIELREDIRRRREGADAVGDGANFGAAVTHFGRVPDALDAQPIRIGTVDGDRVRDREGIEAAFDQIPGEQSTHAQIRSDDQNRRGAAVRHTPLRKADQDRVDLRHALDRQRPVAVRFIQQRGVLETFRSERDNPKIGRRMVDHDRHRALEADEQAQLDRYQHNREDNADHRRGEAKLVVKQISGGELQNQWHRHCNTL
jgi:choline dehydrogenase-like flavoprotein